MPDVAVITAIYDGYDTLKPSVPQDGTDAEWVLVTDDRQIPDGFLGWRVVYDPQPGVSPMRAAKAAKFRPWEYTDAPASVWADASVRVISPSFAADFLAAADPLATFAHPVRDCLFDEAEATAALGMAKYAGEPITEQAAHYRRAGHPEHWGLWETTILARHHTPEVVKLGDAWTAEMDLWSPQDQVSFPFVLRDAGLRPAVLPGAGTGSAWHVFEPGSRHFPAVTWLAP
jgi:TOD1/MUCI70, glycosyltransferase-like domain